MASLTSADAVITFTIADLYATPQTLQGFGADNIYDSPVVEVAQSVMGVDGYMSAGMVFNIIPQTFTIQADSKTCDLFDTLWSTSINQRTIYRIEGRTTLKSLGKSYISSNGVLISWNPMPTAGKILQARQALVHWNRVEPSPV